MNQSLLIAMGVERYDFFSYKTVGLEYSSLELQFFAVVAARHPGSKGNAIITCYILLVWLVQSHIPTG